MQQNISYKSGFVGIVGKPNAGKSTLLNWLLGEKIALVSNKANASRKRVNAIVMHKDNQIIFVDTPGLHEKEQILNKFMLKEALKAIGDSDLLLFLVDVRDDISVYEDFLRLNKKNKPHILVLTKIDLVDKEFLENKIQEYEKIKQYLKIIPISAKEGKGRDELLDTIIKYLPYHEYYFDPEFITTEHIRDIYKELIREAVFNILKDELPYETDIIINKIEEYDDIDKVYADIIVQRESQKRIVIGHKGQTIKKIGIYARKLLTEFSQKRIYLELFVKIKPNWTKNKMVLNEIGYILDK